MKVTVKKEANSEHSGTRGTNQNFILEEIRGD
jgi:hypothetical protein